MLMSMTDKLRASRSRRIGRGRRRKRGRRSRNDSPFHSAAIVASHLTGLTSLLPYFLTSSFHHSCICCFVVFIVFVVVI